MIPMHWNDDSPRECTRFFELDWYDGIQAALYSVRNRDGTESWFIAQLMGVSYGGEHDGTWYLSVTTLSDALLSTLLDGRRASAAGAWSDPITTA